MYLVGTIKFRSIIVLPTHLDQERNTDSENSDSSDEGFSETKSSKSEYLRIFTSQKRVKMNGRGGIRDNDTIRSFH